MKGPTMSDPSKQKQDLGLLEEDDDFEEFPTETWTSGIEEDYANIHPWEDNWDDDVIEEDFSIQLWAETEKIKSKKT